jgi:hypothetical protein
VTAPDDSADAAARLLAEALPYLQSYRAQLLESRSGAASDKEQRALGLTKLIDRVEEAIRRPRSG